MKSTFITLSLLALAAAAPAAIVIPVTGWVTTNGDATFTGGSASTSSPSVTGLPGDTIAANFATVTLADGEALTLTGSITLTGSAGGNQFRFGLFDGDNPVTTGNGSGFVGFNADAPSSATGGLKFGDGTAANPFSGGASTTITSMSNPGGAAPAGIALDYSLTITRDGANLDVEASISNTGGGGTWSSTSGVFEDYATTQYTYDSVAFLMGGSIGGTTASYSNVTVTYNNIPEPATGLLSGLALFILLQRRRK